MKDKYLIISALMLLTAFLSGCDFVRSSLGRPTSADIEAKRQIILEGKRQEAQAQAELEAARKYSSDSLAAFSYFTEKNCRMNRRSDLPATIVSAFGMRYCIIAGAFGSPENAEKLAAELTEKGYVAELLVYRSGIRAVGVAPTDDIVELKASYAKLMDGGLIPADAWILVNE